MRGVCRVDNLDSVSPPQSQIVDDVAARQDIMAFHDKSGGLLDTAHRVILRPRRTRPAVAFVSGDHQRHVTPAMLLLRTVPLPGDNELGVKLARLRERGFIGSNAPELRFAEKPPEILCDLLGRG